MDENNGMTAAERVLKEPEADMNWLERLTGVFFSPVKTFRDIAKKADWGMMPMIILILTAMMANGAFVVTQDVEQLTYSQLEEKGYTEKLTDEQIDRQLKIGSIMTRVMILVSSVIGVPIALLVVAGVIMIILKIAGGTQTFKESFAVAAYSWLVMAVKNLLFAALMFFRKVESFEEMAYLVKSNLMLFFDASDISRPLASLASSIDLFTVWILVLMTIGYAAVSKKSRGLTGLTVFALWFFILTLKVGAAFIQAKLGG